MQFISTGSNHFAQMEALVKQLHGLSARTLIRIFSLHENLNLLGKESTDGGSSAAGESSQFLQRVPGETYCHVLFGHIPLIDQAHLFPTAVSTVLVTCLKASEAGSIPSKWLACGISSSCTDSPAFFFCAT